MRPTRLLRIGVAGVLMGLANLVPGVSGGTMILVTGLYRDVVASVAELSRLRFTRTSVALVGLLGGIAGVVIVSLAGPVHYLVTAHQSAMYALFIGLTLGGVPPLYRAIRPLTLQVLSLVVAGCVVMYAVRMIHSADGAAARGPSPAEVSAIQPRYGVDFAGGILAASAMVLPGISGSYMLLVIDRYETVLASIDATRRYVLSRGAEGDPGGLGVVIPLGLGVLIGILLITNVLKWLLRRHERPTLALLTGILLGSVLNLWPFDAQHGAGHYALGGLLAAIGFGVTFGLSRLSSEPAPQH